jgi:glyoxylase-like metal-dependent hydrolase (beta-lactamase superfamily II)
MKPLQSDAISIFRVVETERLPTDPAWLYPHITPPMMERGKAWLDNRFIEPAAGKLILGMQSFVIRTRAHNILVDTCNGNHKRRPGILFQNQLNTPYLHNLAAIGLRPEDIDFVLCTHLHSDHVGWNTIRANGHWVPTFPKAKYLFSAEDFDALNRRHQADPFAGGAFADSVLPIIDARQAALVEVDHVIEQQSHGDGVWLEGTPGHTPGHVAVHVKSGAFHAVLTGDILHHPIQLSEPELVVGFDEEPGEAMATRRRLLRTYADSQTIILPAHFPTPTAGRIVTWGDTYRFRWIER